MAYDNDPEGGTPPEEKCETAKHLLDKISCELAKFQAKKLDELKTELDAFVKKQDTVVADYRTKFPVLRKLWCDRQVDVDRLCSHIRCEFPLKDDKWKKLIEKCICTPRHELCCLEQRIAARKKCCAGPLQRARDAAQADFDGAKKHLDWMQNLAAKIDAILKDEQTLIGGIETVPPTERPVALYLFIKLRSMHIHVAPYDASAECKKVCSDFDFNVLCCEVDKSGCPPEDGACAPKDKTPDLCANPPEPDCPWLMCPDKYSAALDCAWEKYHKAKEALGEADGAYKAAPDDIDSLAKKLTDDRAGLDDAIKKCLKDSVKPQGDCCKETEPPKKSGC